MRRTLLDRLIKTDYGQFDLLWGDGYGFDGDFDRFFAGQSNGLVGAASGQGLYLNIAKRSGGSPVRIVLLDSAPAPDPDQWEDIAEVSVTIPAGASPSWSTWAAEHSGSARPPSGELPRTGKCPRPRRWPGRGVRRRRGGLLPAGDLAITSAARLDHSQHECRC
jgi:hypothetical protein